MCSVIIMWIDNIICYGIGRNGIYVCFFMWKSNVVLCKIECFGLSDYLVDIELRINCNYFMFIFMMM